MQAPTPSLRIVHVVDSLEFGGLERVMTDLAKAQQSAGHQVSVFSINTTQGFKRELIDAGIPVIEGHKKTSLDRHVLGRLRQWVKDQAIDIVHAHNFVPNYHAAFATFGLKRRPALVCTLHDMGMRLGNRKLRWLFKLSLMRTTQVAMVGQQVRDRHVATGLVDAARASTVMNGIPVERFRTTPQRRADARRALDLNPTDLVVGCVGRLVPLKNHRRMIEVMPDLLARHANLKLVIVGDGPLLADLQAQVQQADLTEQVRLAGQRSNVADLLPAFDVFALPSQTEGLSIALLEACATSLAIVATRVGGNPDIIEDGQTGLLIPTDDNAALARALNALLDDAALRLRLGQQACDWVQDRASATALRRAYDSCYQVARLALS